MGKYYKKAKKIQNKCGSPIDAYPFRTITNQQLDYLVNTIKQLEEVIKKYEEERE